jgi:uncharacterized protein with HEPN domain
MRTDRERLEDVLEAIERIEKYAASGQKRFQTDELIQNWITHHLQIIGEACRALSPNFQKSHPDIPWAEIVGMRNILVHDYFGIDLVEVWEVVERDLPLLKPKIKTLLQSLPKN